MKDNPANAIKDTMWSFLMDHATTQKDGGQRKDKPKNYNWNNLDMLFMEIVIEATALVLSGEWDKLEGGEKNEFLFTPNTSAE